MTEHVISLIVKLAETGIFYYMISHSLTWKYHGFRKYLCIPTVFAALVLCNYFVSHAALLLLLTLLIEIAAVFLFTCDRHSKKLFWSCLFTVLSFVAPKIILISSSLAVDHYLVGIYGIQRILEFSSTRYWNDFIALILLTVLIFVIIHIRQDSLLFPKYTLGLLLWLTLLGISAAEALIAVIIQQEQRYTLDVFTPLYFIGIYFMAIFVLLFIFITFIGIIYKRNLALQELNKQYILEKEQYKILDETNKVLRAWRHENMNHLQTILQLEENKQYTESRQYIEQLINDFHSAATGIHTGNYAIDAIISTKKIEAAEKGIDFTYELFLPDERLLPLDNVLLSALLGNMLNNAIEACSMIDEASMHLVIKPMKSTLLIELKNSSNGVYRYNSDHRLRSTKKDKEHGIGLKRIADIVKSAEGFYQLKPESDLFLISVVLPLKDSPEELSR